MKRFISFWHDTIHASPCEKFPYIWLISRRDDFLVINEVVELIVTHEAIRRKFISQYEVLEAPNDEQSVAKLVEKGRLVVTYWNLEIQTHCRATLLIWRTYEIEQKSGIFDDWQTFDLLELKRDRTGFTTQLLELQHYETFPQRNSLLARSVELVTRSGPGV